MLRVADELLGASVQCPGCKTTFTGQNTAVQPAPSPETTDDPDDLVDEETLGPTIRGLPPVPKPFKVVLISASKDTYEPVSDREGSSCPVCSSRVAGGMQRCPVCNAQVGPGDPDRPETIPRRDYEPDRSQLIATLGTISVLLATPGLCGAIFPPFALASLVGTVIGLSAVVMGRTDIDQMDRNIMDPDGRGGTLSGKTQGMLGAVLGIIGGSLGGLNILLKLLNGNW